MRAILVGPASARDRLRWDLEALSIQAVAEFVTMAEARRPGADTAVLVTPAEPSSETAHDIDDVFEEALTHRELEVLELLAEGLPNKGIAERLRISDQQVKVHVASIVGKLGASNRVETVRRAVRRGLLSL